MKFQQAFAPGREGFSEAAGAWAVEQKENKNNVIIPACHFLPAVVC
jgi:hypothetical protein